MKNYQNILGPDHNFGNRPLLADGAWGTEMIRKGLSPGHCPEEWNISHPEVIREIAASYADAGSDCVLTNTFGANRVKLKHFGFEDRLAEFNTTGARIVREAVGDAVAVIGDMTSTGKMLVARQITETELFDTFSEQASALAEGGVDAIIVETMIDAAEMKIAVEAAVKSTQLPVIASMTYQKMPNGSYRTVMGNTPQQCVDLAVAAGASVVGANCGTGIADYVDLAKDICSFTQLPVWIKANAGKPVATKEGVRYSMSAEEFASHVPELLAAGVAVVGGCCGTTPAFIRAIKETGRF